MSNFNEIDTFSRAGRERWGFIPYHVKKHVVFKNHILFSEYWIDLVGWLSGWLVVLGFNATLTPKVLSWRSVTHTCFLAFSHQY